MPNCIVIYATGEIDKIKFNKYEMVNLKSNSEVIYINNLCFIFQNKHCDTYNILANLIVKMMLQQDKENINNMDIYGDVYGDVYVFKMNETKQFISFSRKESNNLINYAVESLL